MRSMCACPPLTASTTATTGRTRWAGPPTLPGLDAAKHARAVLLLPLLQPLVQLALFGCCAAAVHRATRLWLAQSPFAPLAASHPKPQQSVEMGAVAVLAERPLPDALLPVVVVPDTLRALSALADAFYERPSRRMRTVGLVGR